MNNNKYIVLYQSMHSDIYPFVLINPAEKSIYKFDLITRQANKIASYKYNDIGVTISLVSTYNLGEDYTIKLYSNYDTTIAYFEFISDNIKLNLENSDLLHEFYEILAGDKELSDNIFINCCNTVIFDGKYYDTHFKVPDDIIKEVINNLEYDYLDPLK